MAFFDNLRATAMPSDTDPATPVPVRLEIFVQSRFSQLELSSVTAALEIANDVQPRFRFEWSFVSDTPGLISNRNILVRAEPAIDGELLKDCLIVLGGAGCVAEGWMRRVRAMQIQSRPVVLFSDAATEYAKQKKTGFYPATTHWRDIPILNEIGDFADMSTQLGEYTTGILTCAGRGFAIEAAFNLVAECLNPQERAEMASLLMLDRVRGFDREQPIHQEQGNTFLEGPLQKALQLMEETIEAPLQISELTQQIGVSPRQLERLFKIQLNSSPAKTYKMLRLKRARSLILETRMSLLDIAIACGFSGTSSMSKAFRQSFGVSPNQLRK
ncbi:helix-turn-helix domain-containing protein [Shimia sp. SDUM112013]|uniref:GlxA family transcriptional regulator n=1 Tax=Shimia sp. SDUM112013 TaxID=3136160 RepID=UPI0032EFC0F4